MFDIQWIGVPVAEVIKGHDADLKPVRASFVSFRRLVLVCTDSYDSEKKIHLIFNIFRELQDCHTVAPLKNQN